MFEHELVVLDQDHPGFRDAAYRARRDTIARVARAYRDGSAVPDVPYTDDEHAVWRTVQESLAPLHARYACSAYQRGAAMLDLPRARIPQLAEVNRALAARGGFSLVPVAGLVSPRVFMQELFSQRFLSTQYIRHHSRPLYTPEPDVIHELVGHAPTLIEPAFIALNRAFGSATLATHDERAVTRLIRLYWYTLEFGAVEEAGQLRVFGAGLLSSFGELGRFEAAAELVPLDIGRVVETPFDPTSYQSTIFVAPSFDALSRTLLGYLADEKCADSNVSSGAAGDPRA
ncbi:MAG: phenylalanine 4-monooxygenase [Polyangiaceae bacterium]